MVASPLRYSLVCALVLGGLAELAAQGPRLGLLPALLLLPLVAGPAWVALAYPAAVRAAQMRSLLREGARPWWAALLGGARLRQALAVPVALLAAWAAAWTIVGQGWTGLAWMAAAAALLYPVARALDRQTVALKPYARLRPVLLLAPPLVAGLLTAAWMGLAGAQTLSGGTLAQHVAAEPRYEGPSALMAWAVDGTAVLNGAKAWGLAWAEGRVGGPAALWRLAGTFGQFWLLAGVFAGLLLPAGEARRILRPTEADRPTPTGPGRAALAGFLVAVLMAAAVSSAAKGEAWASAQHRPVAMAASLTLADGAAPGDPPSLPPPADAAPELTTPIRLTPTSVRDLAERERFGELACLPGTIASVEALDRELRAMLLAQRSALTDAAAQGFGAMRANVPSYLDWYYSLSAEYARTGHLLIGNAEDYLKERTLWHLEQGEPLAELTAVTERILGNASLLEAWEQERGNLLGGCELAASDTASLVVVAEAPPSLLTMEPSFAALDLRDRLGAATVSGAAGGLAGALVGKTVGKLIAKEAFGLAVEAVGKLAAGKLAGWMGGAAAGAGGGAVIGSVLPGLGTTVGAAVGGIAGGLVAWVGTDYVLLELEEAVSRESFEGEILAAIAEAEAEFLNGLGPPP